MTSKQVSYQHFSETSNISEYKWIIHNFSSVTDKVLRSPKFANYKSNFMSDSEWQLELHTDNLKKEYKGFIGLFLRSLNNSVITVDCEISVSSNVKNYGNHNFTYTYVKPVGYGYHTTIEHDPLLSDLKKGDDTLITEWKISFSTKASQLGKTHLNLLKDVSSLIQTREVCDVSLISSNGIQLAAHKAILVCRSKVFSAMFQHNTKECQDNKVNIEDIDSDTLKDMLEFMYTGEVKCMPNKAENLLIAADKYDLVDLRKICIRYISENISNTNIKDLIQFAHSYNVRELKIQSIQYFRHYRKSIMSDMGREFMKNLPRDMLENFFYDLAINSSSNTGSDSDTSSDYK